ncbi:sn-glycerol-3-phosphate ABC transporter ATP-binding protein UgpC [Candidatus Poribacteria bacterium]|nr:sn-glycerol-3-phosphate ABC transporter ATP-binding protein UgpC [Candidatus Poribacteria bacterium]
MAALVLKNLSKSYKNGAVGVCNLNIEVPEGELMVLVGPSGSGKSTALRLIAGLETPTTGEIHIAGMLANNIPPRDRDIAMVFQDYALYPHLDVAGNLEFGLKMRGCPKNEIRSRVGEVAAMLGISELLKRKPKELSGGQRQRVALGRALVRKPKVFLFDEPLSNLDASLRVRLRQEIKDIHHALGATMVYVTHDQSEAMTLGERIAVMNTGTLEQVGSPVELYRDPQSKFVANFFGNPAMNFVPCSVGEGGEGTEIELGVARFSLKTRTNLPVARQKAFLGFRPEDVSIGDLSGENSLAGRARVLTVEPLGSETLIYLETESFRFVVRVLGYADAGVGAEVGYAVHESKLHFFDEQNGKRIPEVLGTETPER